MKKRNSPNRLQLGLVMAALLFMPQIIRAQCCPPEITITPQDPFCANDPAVCEGAVRLPFAVDENCDAEALALVLLLDLDADGSTDGDLLSGYDAELEEMGNGQYEITATLPIGGHAVRIFATDGCGNQAEVSFPVEVLDCAVAAPDCINGGVYEYQSLDTNGDGLIDSVWVAVPVEDLLAAPGDDCSALSYSINLFEDPVDPAQSELLLGCEIPGVHFVEVWAHDAAGNSKKCNAYIQLEPCPLANWGVGAVIETEYAEPIDSVQVFITGSGVDTFVYTNNGSYSLAGLYVDSVYTITPSRDGDDLNGVSTFDMVLISKHILGVQPLNSAYKYLAADVNRSGSISVMDLIVLRALILSQIPEFPDAESWRFVQSEYVFPPYDSIPSGELLESVTIGPGLDYRLDFIGIKLGDIDNSAQTQFLMPPVEDRYNGAPLPLQLPARSLQPGELVRLPVYAPQLTGFDGWQATLEAAPELELLRVEPGQAEASCFSPVRNNRVSVSHLPLMETVEDTGAPLFWLVVQASAKTDTRQALRISESGLRAEAYAKNGQIRPVSLAFESSSTAFELLPNQPNPFREETLLRFRLPEGGPAHLRVQDVNGRLLHESVIDGQAGMNAYRLTAESLPKGLLSVSLQYAGEQRVAKIIKQ